jgi:hypothetical protein
VLGASSVSALQGVSTAVHASGETGDYSLMMTTTFTVAQAGLYSFQVGADWGRGGVAAVVDNSTSSAISELVRTDDIWWAHNWSHPDVFDVPVNLGAGTSYTLAWIGFEGCCGGASTIRFSYEGSPYVPVSVANLAPYTVPEAGLAMLASAAAALWLERSRRRA